MPVTLVHTDVVGSTELWEWDSEAMDDAQGIHDQIIRSQLREFFGYEVGRVKACTLACGWLIMGN